MTIDREVWAGVGRRSMEGRAGKGVETEERVMVEAVGLMGVAGRLWLWYHLKTSACKWVVWIRVRGDGEGGGEE